MREVEENKRLEKKITQVFLVSSLTPILMPPINIEGGDTSEGRYHVDELLQPLVQSPPG